MKITRLVAVAITVAALGAGSVSAQIKETQPAEFPPASYKGKQYVDSKGCVFIRAGIDGNVSWVPRVTRKRKVVCGFQPTGGTQVASAAPAAAAAQPPVQQITIDQPAPAPKPVAVAAPKPRPKVVRQTAPKPARRVLRKPAAPKPVKVAAPKRVEPVPTPPAAAAPRTTRVASACPGASALSQQYLRGNGKSQVRCGPQAAPIVAGSYAAAAPVQARQAAPRSFGGLFKRRPAAPVTAAKPVAAAAPVVTSVGDHTRIVPRHVAVNRINTTNVSVPRGYRPVWEDGRLNPKRVE